MTVLILPRPEPVWTCDAEGNWVQQSRIRLREGNGWKEIKSTPETTARKCQEERNGSGC